jgi:hypothetical protein
MAPWFWNSSCSCEMDGAASMEDSVTGLLIHRTSLSGGYHSWIRISARDRLPSMRFRGFPQTLQTILGQYLKIDHNHFFLHNLQFIIHVVSLPIEGTYHRQLKHVVKLPNNKPVMYVCVSKSFRTGRLERELQMVQLSAIRCSCIAVCESV